MLVNGKSMICMYVPFVSSWWLFKANCKKSEWRPEWRPGVSLKEYNLLLTLNFVFNIKHFLPRCLLGLRFSTAHEFVGWKFLSPALGISSRFIASWSLICYNIQLQLVWYPVGLAVIGPNVVWTNTGSKKLVICPKVSNGGECFQVALPFMPRGLFAAPMSRAPGMWLSMNL